MGQNNLSSIDQKTKIAGSNRLELLLFNLTTDQTFAINVFKIKEIIGTFEIHGMPASSKDVCGLINIRGNTFSVIDLCSIIEGVKNTDFDNSVIILTEINTTSQAFLVKKVQRIINTKWEDVSPAPKELGASSYLTAITNFEDNLIEVLDVEQILEEIHPSSYKLDEKFDNLEQKIENISNTILICDDSAVAIKQIKSTINQISKKLNVIDFNNGKRLLDHLLIDAETLEREDITNKYLCIISDIEMPEMDGYKLTTEIKAHPKLNALKVILHSSLSGVFNESLTEKVGANYFIPKFKPDEIAGVINKVCDEIIESKNI